MLQEPLHSLVVGSLLGDGCLCRNGYGYRMRFDHSINASDYVLWKHYQFSPIALPIRKVEVYDKRTAKSYGHLRFDTRTIVELVPYAQQFYVGRRKIVPPTIQADLSELALAVWYMDDGHRRRDCNALRLNTHAFQSDDLERLIVALQNRYGLRVCVHRVARNQHVLYIPSADAERFCDIIRGHVPPCMEYKLL